MIHFILEYEDLRKTLRDTKIKVSDDISKSIPDYVDFRRRHIGSLNLNKVTGIEVDSAYEELSAKYPEFFPSDVLNPADRLLKIAEVADSLGKKIETLDTYYKDDKAKADLKHEFTESVSGYIESMINVKRFNDALQLKTATEITNEVENNTEPIQSAYDNLYKAQKESEKVISGLLLTDKDKTTVDRLLKGEINLDEIPKDADASLVKKAYDKIYNTVDNFVLRCYTYRKKCIIIDYFKKEV